MKTLEGLLEFVAVVEFGTFTGAAGQLGVSVSHVSRQIAALESRLAAQLFVRTTRQMNLTEAGKRLFETTQPLLEDLLQAQETVLETHDAIEGDLKISMAGKFAEEQLVPVLTLFCNEHPNIRLTLDLSARNSRTGLGLFAVYLTAYVVFVIMAAYAPGMMGQATPLVPMVRSITKRRTWTGLPSGPCVLPVLTRSRCARRPEHRS